MTPDQQAMMLYGFMMLFFSIMAVVTTLHKSRYWTRFCILLACSNVVWIMLKHAGADWL